MAAQKGLDREAGTTYFGPTPRAPPQVVPLPFVKSVNGTEICQLEISVLAQFSK
jgi:hypothetical protein